MDKHEVMKKAIEDFEKRAKKRKVLETDMPECNIGGLYICTKCFNVHRPGPCMDLGISLDDFARRKKKKLGIKL